MTKISKGARRHLLALYTPGVPCTLTLRDRTHWPMVRARQSLKKLERSMRDGSCFTVEPKGVSIYEQMMADTNRDVSMALLAGVYP